MESRRFDDLTRVFATGVSRRSLVKWLAGTVGGSTALAVGHRATQAAGVGEPCTTNADCDPYLLCVDNGGTLICQNNCQTGVDCSASADANCCSRCCGGCNESGSCSASCSVEGHPCQPGGGHPYWFSCCSGICNSTTLVCEADVSCLDIGASCAEDNECCSLNCDRLTDTCCLSFGSTCTDSGCCGELACGLQGTCCFPEGSDCGSDTDCCDDLVCSGQLCTAPCLASNVMNPGCGTTTPDCCETNAIYNPTNCMCSVRCPNGVSCLSDANCDSDEYCNSGCCVPCLADGEGVYCATSQACCSGNCELNNCGCRSIQTDCTDDSQCCSGICGDVEPRVCLPPGPSCAEYSEYCESDSDCCNDHPRFEAFCYDTVCLACIVTNSIPDLCEPGTSTLPCCDIEATWNDLTCVCEILCQAKGTDCYDDHDCCDDLQCVYGTCGHYPSCGMEKSPCDDKSPCCKGYACYDGYCKPVKKPEPPKEEPAGYGTASVDTLPSTGAGPDAGGAGSIGALLAGGAAAAMAVWLKKGDSEQVGEES